MNTAVAEDFHVSKDSAGEVRAPGSMGAPAQHTDTPRNATNLSKFWSHSDSSRCQKEPHTNYTPCRTCQGPSARSKQVERTDGQTDEGQNLCPIREVPGSNIQPDTSYAKYVFFSVFLVKPKRYR